MRVQSISFIFPRFQEERGVCQSSDHIWTPDSMNENFCRIFLSYIFFLFSIFFREMLSVSVFLIFFRDCAFSVIQRMRAFSSPCICMMALALRGIALSASPPCISLTLMISVLSVMIFESSTRAFHRVSSISTPECPPRIPVTWSS